MLTNTQLRLVVTASTLMVAMMAQWICAAESLDELLKRGILDRNIPLAEVQAFVRQRIPLMKSYSSAEQWQAESAKLRDEILNKVVYRGRAVQWREAATKVEWLETIPGGPGYQIRKLRYEALPGMWIPALLYLPDRLSGKVPCVLNVNGHSPEGKQYPPKQMRCINQAKRGMLALNIEWLGMGQLRTDGFAHSKMNQLDLCGTSGLAPFYLCMKRGLDVLLGIEHADNTRVAVTGLSGGGWQTILLSALDTRVTMCNPVAGYSSFLTRIDHFKDLGDSEQTPNDLATLADYTHLTAMLAPRPTLLTYNVKDNCCFESGYALPPLVDAAAPIFRLLGHTNSLRSHVNYDPGTHNFEVDNRQALYRMFGDHFYGATVDFNATEIPSEDELKTAEQLMVEIPGANEDFHTLANSLSQTLPTSPPSGVDELRRRLRQVVKAHDYSVAATEVSRSQGTDFTAIGWKLKMDEQWTVPVREFVPHAPSASAILVGDSGTSALAAKASELLRERYRVCIIDPFYFGESKIKEKDWLFALLVATVGERPLGLQASQIAATARWIRSRHASEQISLVSVGPRSSVFTTVAAVLEPTAIHDLKQYDALESLKQVIDRNMSVVDAPELFCFGLLELCDLPHLRRVWNQ